MKLDIVKSSEKLRNGLLNRWEELGIQDKIIAQDALKRGMKGITIFSLSLFRTSAYHKGSLNQFQILWLSHRWGIPVSLKVGTPILAGNKLNYVIEPYSEEQALKELYEKFPETKKMKGFIKVKPRKKRVNKNG